MNGHRSDIKHNRNKPVAKHFNEPDHTLDNLKLAVIKEVKGKTNFFFNEFLLLWRNRP